MRLTMTRLVPRRHGRRRRPGRGAGAAPRLVASPPAPTAARPPRACMCDTDAHQTLLADRAATATSRPPTATPSTCGATATSPRGFQLPGPTLCVTLRADGHRHPAQHPARGRPRSSSPGRPACRPTATRPSRSSTPGGSLTSLVQPPRRDDGLGHLHVHRRVSPGTYLYETGTDVDKQVQMGLYGALVVRPAGHPEPGQRPRRLRVQPAPRVRLPALRGRPRPAPGGRAQRSRTTGTPTRARYFMINGRSMPDTLAPNNASWLPNQPYGALVHIQPYDAATNPLPGAHPLPQRRARSTTRSTRTAATSASSTRTARALQSADRPGPVATSSTTSTSSPARRVDALDGLARRRALERRRPTRSRRQLPGHHRPAARRHRHLVQREPLPRRTKNPLPTNITANNECGEYYHVAHSHALQQATNYGATFGGMMTVFRIDPPAGCPAK